jgi:predicted nucleic acid-binding Zn ribbon protein
VISLAKLLPRLLLQAGDSQESREQSVFAAWSVTVGFQVQRATAPIRLEAKTLVVAVVDSNWRTQLAGMRGQIIFKINSIVGANLVSRIQFVINEELVRCVHKMPAEVKFVAPDEQALPLGEKAENIEDPELRALFLRAAGKCLDRRAR